MPDRRASRHHQSSEYAAADTPVSGGRFFSPERLDGDHPEWYLLDNQARIFPPILSDRFPTVFRVSALLKQPVRLAALERALSRAYRRMPYFSVTLRRGVFWHYLERCEPAGVRPDRGSPCTDRPRYGQRRALVLVYARGRRIAVEASHIVTDGTGALEFLQRLLALYAEEDSVPAATAGRIVDEPSPETLAAEEEYASRVHAAGRLPPPPVFSRAWHLPGARLPRRVYRVTVLRYDASRLRERAAHFGVTLTDYVLAVFLYALQRRYHRAGVPRRRGRPIRVLVPVNMRPMVGSGTMRNFFVYIMIELDPRLGVYELDEIATKVHHQMRAELDRRSLHRQLARNVRAERRLAIRLIPIVLKDVILRIVHRVRGETVNTASLSNLGRVDLDSSISDRVESFDFLPPRSPVTGVNMTMIGFRDTLSLGFGSSREDRDVEAEMARALATEGCTARLRTNGR